MTDDGGEAMTDGGGGEATTDDGGEAMTDDGGGEATTDDGGEAMTDDGGGEATTDDGGEAMTDDGGEATTDDGGEATTDDGGEATTDDGGEATTDDGGEATTDDGGEATTDDGGEANSGEEGSADSSSQATVTHVVQFGETLGTIAQQYNVTQDEIMVANNITNPNVIYLGQSLIIPTGEVSSGDEGDDTVTNSTTYTVQPGDTLSGIAQSFGVTMQAIQEANGLASANVIYVGQVLTIPAP